MLFLALGDAKVPDARYFAFWWNIGFIIILNTIRELELTVDLLMIGTQLILFACFFSLAFSFVIFFKQTCVERTKNVLYVGLYVV